MGGDNALVTPLIDPLGVLKYEISRLLGFRWCHQLPEYLVEWKDYDVSYYLWVHQDSLMEDVQGLVAAYDKNPTVFRGSAVCTQAGDCWSTVVAATIGGSSTVAGGGVAIWYGHSSVGSFVCARGGPSCRWGSL